MLTLTVTTETTIAPSQVMSVYSGRRGKCMCGCAGRHWYASAHRERASEHRGYGVTDDEVNDVQVMRVLNLIRRAPDAKMENGLSGETILYADVGQRSYVAYLLTP